MNKSNTHWSLAYMMDNSGYHQVCQHPYLQAFEQGTLSYEHIQQCWLLQQAWLSRSFPLTIAAVLSKIPSHYYEIAFELSNIIHEEVWRPEPKTGHPKLFNKLHQRLTPDWQLTHLPAPLASTREFVEKRQDFVLSKTLLPALGFLIANEFINADLEGKQGIMVSYYKGLLKILDTNKEPYTRAHCFEEADEIETLLNFIDTLSQDLTISRGEFEQAIATGIDQLCTLRVDFFNGLAQQAKL